jgi:hypothetical protein
VGKNYSRVKFLKIIISVNRENVELALAKKNRTKGWLAERLSTHQTHLARVLGGINNPSPKLRAEMSRVFRKCLDWDELFIIRRRDD